MPETDLLRLSFAAAAEICCISVLDATMKMQKIEGRPWKIMRPAPALDDGSQAHRATGT
jgi:hypothetical protein